MFRTLKLIPVVMLGVAAAQGNPYWVSWEGDDWPENQGWTRNWGNWDGQYQGPGAYRTLENGILTYDSLYDPGVFDYYYMERPGQMDPQQPGEHFELQWRLKVSQVAGLYDPDVALRSDDAWAVGLAFAYDHIWSIFEDVNIAFTPGVFHDYRLVSANMRDFQLYVDNQLTREGSFVHLTVQSYVAWGDGVQGAASLHEWDYMRYGVIPEPATGAIAAVFLAWRAAKRR